MSAPATVGFSHLRFALSKMNRASSLELNYASVEAMSKSHDELVAALEFYARGEHWMALAGDSDGPSKVLIANGDTPDVDGWAVARAALAEVSA